MKEVIWILKEINQLDSGETGFHVELYETEDKAKQAMKEQAQSHIEEYGARITYEDEYNIQLRDDEGNLYEFIIELDVIR